MSFGFINSDKITLDTFSSDSIPTDLINKISKLSDDQNNNKGYANSRIPNSLNNDNKTVQSIDPVPYIASLKSVQDKLLVLMDECDQKRSAFQKSAMEREQAHFLNVVGESSSGNDLKQEFNSLYSEIKKLSLSKIDPLGEKLRKANTLMENSVNIIFLMKIYNHFYLYDTPPIELLTERKNSNSTETAVTLSELKQLSSKLVDDQKLPNSVRTNQLIDEFSTNFENDQLKSFNTYYQSKNFARLQNIVKTLFKYNNGVNIVEFFVNSHPIFTQMQDNVKQQVDQSYWESISNPVEFSGELDHDSLELLKSARNTIISEIDSITTIFQEHSKQAFSTLILKITENIIEPRLRLLISNANAESKLCYLRILQLFYNCFNEMFVTQIHTALLDKEVDLAFELEKATNMIFGKYLLDNAYISIERENLTSLIDVLITPFEKANKDALRERKLTLKIEQFKLKSESDPSGSTSLVTDKTDTSPYQDATSQPQLNKASTSDSFDLYLPDKRVLKDKFKRARKYVPSSNKLKKVSGVSTFIKLNEKYSLFDRYKSNTNQNIEVNTSFIESIPEANVSVDSKTILSLQVTQSIYKLILESLTRSIDLVPSRMSFNAVEIFKIMSYKIGPSYLALGLESIYETYIVPHLNNKGVFNRGPTLNIDLSFLSQFYNVFAQVYLLSVIVKKSFYPLATNEQDSLYISETFNSFLQDVEIGVNIMIDDVVDVIKDTINSILNKQPVTDYTLNSEMDRTPMAETLTQYMEHVLRNVLRQLSFDPQLKFRLISRISDHFLSNLILHLSHLKITMNGFTTLTHDLAQYILIFSNLKIDDFESGYDTEVEETDTLWEKEQLDQLQNAYKILNEIPGLYTCQPESLREFCKEGQLNDLKKSVIKDFVSNREDFQEWFLSQI